MLSTYKSQADKLSKLLNGEHENLSLTGLEKEALRVSNEGNLAQSFHPKALGSKLTHPFITTDYAEPLLELITPPYANHKDALSFLEQTQTFVLSHLSNDLIWPGSMPCKDAIDNNIHIADYGTSNSAQMKMIYRRGLGHRYGRNMQAIAGVHLNFSFSDSILEQLSLIENHDNKQCLQAFKNNRYFGLIRHYLSINWLIPYCFGASPILNKDFIDNHEGFKSFKKDNIYLPYASSLRLSNIGYQNTQQSELNISYNSLNSYIAGLEQAVRTPDLKFQDIPYCINNKIQQLNSNILQIESEYYSNIRPKRTTRSGERSNHALEKRGIEYIEIRSLDINPYTPLGVDANCIAFIQLILWQALLEPCPSLNNQQLKSIQDNQLLTTCNGYNPSTTLLTPDGETISPKIWAIEYCHELMKIAKILDDYYKNLDYQTAVETVLNNIENQQLPAQRMLRDILNNNTQYDEFCLNYAKEWKKTATQNPLNNEQNLFFEKLANESIKHQLDLEQQKELPIKNYLEKYFE